MFPVLENIPMVNIQLPAEIAFYVSFCDEYHNLARNIFPHSATGPKLT